MKPIMGAVGLSMAAFAALVLVQRSAPAADNSGGPTYMDSQRVLDNFDKKNANPLIPGDGYNVQTNKRTANGNIEIHEKETDIFYIMDGSATIVVGGTAVEPKQTRPGQMTAKDIQNGQTYNLRLSTAAGTEYTAVPIQEGTPRGLLSRRFTDGDGQHTTDGGSTWQNLYLYDPADLQFYFR